MESTKEKPQAVEPAEPRMPKLYGWTLMPDNRIWAERVEDHPVFGDVSDIRTSTVVWIDRLVGLAQTRNTRYILVGKEKPLWP